MALSDQILDRARAIAAGDTLSQTRQERQTQELLGGIQSAATQPGFDAATNPLVAQLAARAPRIGAQVQSNFQNLDERRQLAMFQDAFRVRQVIDSDPQRAIAILESRIRAGGGAGSNMSDTQEILDLIQAGRIDTAKDELDAFLDFGRRTGQLDGTGDTAAIRTFNRMTQLAQDEDVPEDVRKAAQVELGILARAGTTSAKERIAQDEELQEKVISFTDRAERAKAQAREEGKAQGIAVTELEEMEAMLPTLRESVDKLITLSDLATFTAGGRVFDTLSREFGFGATKGSTARAQLESIVDNQTLPLLRQTFGAAFTKEEGDRLRATLLDPNAAPAEKKAQLNNFIDFKTREIEAKRRRVGAEKGTNFTFDPATGTLK